MVKSTASELDGVRRRTAFRRALFVSAAFGLGTVGVAQRSNAQAAAGPASSPTPSSESSQLEDIIVTAQKRSESAQRVPISIAVISPDTFKAAGITDTSTLVEAVPGLVLNRQSGVAEPFLRGVGANVSVPGAEAAVSTYVDGVYYAAGEANIFSLNNIARVEVLKGPQGTLFGRNSIGGVISITTKDPSQDTHVDLMGGYGNYNTWEGSVYATTGLTDKLSVDFSVHYEDQIDGWGRNTTTGRPAFADQHDLEVRSKLLWKLDDRTKITVIGDFLKDRSEEGSNVHIRGGEVDVIGQPAPGFYDLTIDYPSSVNVEQGGLSLRAEHDLGFANLVSITAYRKTHSRTATDVDGTAAPIVNVTNDVNGEQITQEFQLVSEAESNFKWIAGTFFFHNRTRAPATLFGAGLSGPAAYGGLDVFLAPGTVFIGNAQNTGQTTTSYSGFGEATLTIAETTRLTGGLRYTADRQAFDSRFYLLTAPVAAQVTGPYTQVAPPVDFDGPGPYCNAGQPCFQQSSQNFNKLTYRAVADHNFTPDILGYASYTVGFQSGFYNTFVSGSFPVAAVKPETAKAIEVGVKSEFFDHTLRLNIAGFQNKLSNLQVFATLNAVSVATNAGRSTIRGVDADFELLPAKHLSIRGGVEFLDAKYDSYPGAQFFTYVNPADRGTPPHYGVPLESFTADAAGNRLQQAPKFSAVLSASYTLPTSAGEFSLSGSANYNDGFFWDAQNRFAEPSYVLVSSSLNWTAPGGKYEVQLWGRNLLDRHIDLFGNPEPYGDLTSPAAPRTFGVRLRVHI